MRFSILVSALALAAGANAALGAAKVTAKLEQLSQQSKDVTDRADDIAIINLFSKTPEVISGMRDLTTEAIKDVTDIKEGDDTDESEGSDQKKRQDSGYSDSDQEAVCKSFKGLSGDLEKLLQKLIDKHGILSATPFTAPISAVSRTLEGSIDTLAFELIDLVPTCSDGALSDKKSLDKKFVKLEEEYSN